MKNCLFSTNNYLVSILSELCINHMYILMLEVVSCLPSKVCDFRSRVDFFICEVSVPVKQMTQFMCIRRGRWSANTTISINFNMLPMQWSGCEMEAYLFSFIIQNWLTLEMSLQEIASQSIAGHCDIIHYKSKSNDITNLSHLSCLAVLFTLKTLVINTFKHRCVKLQSVHLAVVSK